MSRPHETIKSRTANRRLVKKRIQCLSEALCFVSNLVQPHSVVLRSPLLRQAPKRYASPYNDRQR